MGKDSKPAGCVFVELATATQAQLAIQRLAKGAKLRKCKVSVQLASDPWNLPRKSGSRVCKNRKSVSPVLDVSEDVPNMEPTRMRMRSHSAEAPDRSLPDNQSSKRQKLTADAYMDTGGPTLDESNWDAQA